MKKVVARRWVPGVVLVFCMVSLLYQMREQWLIFDSKVSVHRLWRSASSFGWRASCAPRSSNWLPPMKSSGYLVVRCNGGLNQQRSAICNAVLAARIMNATLVLPDLDTNSFWNDKSGFSGIYDVPHFINTLKKDVRVVHSLPTMWLEGKKRRKLKPFQLRPPRDAPESWYKRIALEKMKEHGAVYLTPFSHRMAEELDNSEYQRLRCRANFHALRFNKEVRNISNIIVQRLRLNGPYIAIHLRFEMDMLAFAGCLDIFTPEEQNVLKRYRQENFADKKLEYTQRRLMGKCPLTPEEVGLLLRAIGFDNSTRIYLAAGEIFGGERFLKPLKALFPLLETHSSVAAPEELGAVSTEGHGLLGPAIDYLVCLLSDIFVPTYDGPSNFANNLLGHRLYFGFRTTIQPDRKALVPLFIALEQGSIALSEFEAAVRVVMGTNSFGSPHPRLPPESFYTNPWSECFCLGYTGNPVDRCPSDILPATNLDPGKEEGDLGGGIDAEGMYDDFHEIE